MIVVTESACECLQNAEYIYIMCTHVSVHAMFDMMYVIHWNIAYLNENIWSGCVDIEYT